MLPLQAGSSLLTTYSLSSTPKPGPATGRLSLRAGSCSCLQLGCWSWLGDWRVIKTAPEREVQVNPVVDSSPTFSRVLDSEAFCPFGVDG